MKELLEKQSKFVTEALNVNKTQVKFLPKK